MWWTLRKADAHRQLWIMAACIGFQAGGGCPPPDLISSLWDGPCGGVQPCTQPPGQPTEGTQPLRRPMGSIWPGSCGTAYREHPPCLPTSGAPRFAPYPRQAATWSQGRFFLSRPHSPDSKTCQPALQPAPERAGGEDSLTAGSASLGLRGHWPLWTLGSRWCVPGVFSSSLCARGIALAFFQSVESTWHVLNKPVGSVPVVVSNQGTPVPG